MGRHDSLLTGAVRAIKGSGGSFKTRHNHLREAQRFVSTLRKTGYGVQQWSNLTNKHVGAVVDHWRDEGLKVATIKEYLSGVRSIARHFGNERIAPSNSAFKLENRVYISNTDKSMSGEHYARVVDALKASPNTDAHRVAAQLMLARQLGLRKEEAFKFNPDRAVLKDGRVYVSDGTKGGRDRILQQITSEGRAAIEYARSVASGKNTMPVGMTEKQWAGKFYRTLRYYGITKDQTGASAHGLRHAWAQERYQAITGFAPPVKFESGEDYRAEAARIAGQSWRQLDRDARLLIKSEMGHGSDRDDVVSQYLGSI